MNKILKIGDIELENNVFLAPMAGVTDYAFRQICASFNPGLMYTEMVSIKALHYNDKKTEDLMVISPDIGPVALQIFTKEPEIIKSVMPKLNNHNNVTLDINMGCPAPKIVNNGEGSALMKDPELVKRIVHEACKWSSKPVTVKIRKGWDDSMINAVQIAKIAQDEGAALVAVHGRTREEFYSGKADRDIIKRVKEAVDIPVIGNGDIFTADDAQGMIDETNCDGIMVARGIEGNPWLLREAIHFLKTGEYLPAPTSKEKAEMAKKHLQYLVQDKGERRGVLEMRKHASWYLKGAYGGNRYKDLINKTMSVEEILHYLDEALNH